MPEPPDPEPGPAPLALRLEPNVAVGDAPMVVRVVIEGEGASDLDPEDLVVVRGELTAGNLGDLSLGLPSDALLDRMVPVTVFAGDEAFVLIPHTTLDPATTYSAGVGSLGLTLTFRTNAVNVPVLRRVWPAGRAAPSMFYCGAAPLTNGSDQEATLDPIGIRGSLRTGSPSGLAPECVRFDAADDVVYEEGAIAHAPLALDTGELLDPAPLSLTRASAFTVPRACSLSERPLSDMAACLSVEDDRIIVRSHAGSAGAPANAAESMLWVILADDGRHALPDAVGVTTAEQPNFVLTGLTPAHPVTLTIDALDTEGHWRTTQLSVVTQPPRPRPVLNEVYANPLGLEPDQEWIEIVNAGKAPASLAGLLIEDLGGATTLPEDAGILAPGAFALVVTHDFDELALYDARPDSQATLIRVEELGKNGLSNSGEPLRLTRDGALLSAFPLAPKPKAGKSVARLSPDAPDDAPESFFVADPPTPGAHNDSGAPSGTDP